MRPRHRIRSRDEERYLEAVHGARENVRLAYQGSELHLTAARGRGNGTSLDWLRGRCGRKGGVPDHEPRAKLDQVWSRQDVDAQALATRARQSRLARTFADASRWRISEAVPTAVRACVGLLPRHPG